ncbi:MAG: DsbA family protein [Thermodesulfovibrionales bacterium]|nr:DsbA family protein [Thermodesulfovibrionales bacterium]
MKEYVDTGKIRYYFLDFPLYFHKQAFKAAEAAECAGDQGKFWEMHEKLFENQKALNPEDMIKYAESMGLNGKNFMQCLDSGVHADGIRQDIAEGKNAGVTGTPSSLLG